jgi:hypothetical protein
VVFVSEIIGERGTADYEGVYQNAVTFGFQVLGSQVSNVVANYLSRKYGMKLEETFSKPASLGEALESTLGAGGILIERRIVKSIYRQLSGSLKDSDIRLSTTLDFERYVKESWRLFQKVHGR